MRFSFTPEEEAWRQELRTFLRENLPGAVGGHDDWTDSEQAWERTTAFAQKVAAKGWVTLAWPKEYGGLARPVMEQAIFNEEMSYHRAPLGRSGVGAGLVGPTLMIYGTEDQKQRYLPPIARYEEVWCQGFSEPNAGSDLASLQTRAERDGDEYVINGQKIWTSAAHHANWCFLFTRTDPNVPKHKGLSVFIVDMKSPGLTVQPLVDMRNKHYFNQVFFENVRVPVANLIGEENGGWRTMTTFLDFERSGIGGVAALRRYMEEVLAYVRERRTALDPALRIAFADRAVEMEVGRWVAYRVVSLQARGQIPNYEASMAKLYQSELSQRFQLTALRALGLQGQLRGESPVDVPLQGRILMDFLESAANTIRGGTSEVQRNIIATRGLHLPRG